MKAIACSRTSWLSAPGQWDLWRQAARRHRHERWVPGTRAFLPTASPSHRLRCRCGCQDQMHLWAPPDHAGGVWPRRPPSSCQGCIPPAWDAERIDVWKGDFCLYPNLLRVGGVDKASDAVDRLFRDLDPPKKDEGYQFVGSIGKVRQLDDLSKRSARRYGQDVTDYVRVKVRTWSDLRQLDPHTLPSSCWIRDCKISRIIW